MASQTVSINFTSSRSYAVVAMLKMVTVPLKVTMLHLKMLRVRLGMSR